MNPTGFHVPAATAQTSAREHAPASSAGPQSILQSTHAMNIEQTLPSSLAWALAWARRLGLSAACIALAACGQNQNWQTNPAFVTVGGTATGLNGTLQLENNGVDPLSVNNNIKLYPATKFQFSLLIASGASYDVTIAAQPTGQLCTLSNARGTTTSNVTTIAADCVDVYTIGGTVSGLNGTLVLENNGTDKLTLTGTGAAGAPFTFATPVASGGAYSVQVISSPPSQTCTVTGGASGKNVTENVNTVTVSCVTASQRALPAVYTDPTTKAINYSPYRTAGGPGVEVPTAAQIAQDLKLLQDAGFKLLRTFASDAVGQSIVQIAAQQFPALQFQLGIYLEGSAANCQDAGNLAAIQNGIALANQYPQSVATVSVGNETSFAANLPVSCLASYIQMVRSQVSQPVTADDDYTFYAGLTSSGEKPDSILPLLDFVSIHVYPFSNSGAWDWQQSTVTPFYPDRAAAMMQASMTWAQSKYDRVANYSYKTAAGNTTTIGASLPIVIGETGWKASLNNHPQPGNPIEVYSQAPSLTPYPVSQVNQKWSNDLSSVNASWTTTAFPPLTVMPFEAFDEPWKQTGQFDHNDDGWGFWDVNRTPRYVLCGFTGEAACTSPDPYVGAGYFQ
jgi:exo-beta-1,3-glucanase (GH17 family)